LDASKEAAILCQNAIDIISKDELESRLCLARKEKRPLRVKAGFDPSAPDIHLGHTVLLRKLRAFQDFGHKVIFIIGDYTAMIGDPTGKTQTRPALSRQEVIQNSKTYQEQAFKILDPNPEKIEMIYNSQWFFDKDMFQIFLEKIGTQYTVARLLERDDFEKRMSQDQPITLREFIYPLLQGYDSVKVCSDVEIGGSDQKFNLIVGRNLQRAFGQLPQIVMTLPLLVGLDGAQKMSKSLGNQIGVLDSPREMFGKLMSIPDTLMESYFDLLTDVLGEAISKSIRDNNLHPRDAKKQLAEKIVSFFHNPDVALRESAEFDRIFRDKQNPQAPEELFVSEKELWVVDLIKKIGAAHSGADARRLIEQQAVTIDGIKITDSKAIISIKNGSLVRAGKKRFVKLVVQKF
jgi:tyrosyl-tRNA synthetase